MTEIVTSYFNIFECGRNILDQLEVTYQQAFMAISAQYEYYKEMTKSLIKANTEGGKLCNENIQQAVINLRAELNVEHERNINNISCDDVYTSPMKKKYVSIINDSVYYESDEHADTISDSSKPVDASKKPIKDTHIVEGINKLSVGVGSVKPAVIRVRIVGQGIAQGNINGTTNIGSNIVTDILTNSIKQLLETNTFQLNSLQSETLVIGPQEKSMNRTNRIISMPSDSRNISRNRINRIDTLGVNKDVWSVIVTTSTVLSNADNIEKFDTSVQSSTTQERNL